MQALVFILVSGDVRGLVGAIPWLYVTSAGAQEARKGIRI